MSFALLSSVLTTASYDAVLLLLLAPRPLTDREQQEANEREWERLHGHDDWADTLDTARAEYDRSRGGVGGPSDERGVGGCDGGDA